MHRLMQGIVIMEEKQRIYYWDNLKGVLILLVVLGHYVEKGLPRNFLWTAIYSIHMPAFIFVNGYFLGRSKRNPVDRIPKVLGLYALMEALNIALALIRKEGLSFTFGNPGYGCWYLLFLTYAYLTAYFIRGKKGAYVLAGAVAVSLLAGLDPTIEDKFRIGQSMYYMPYMIAGFFWKADEIVQWAKRRWPLCACGFVLIQACLFLARNQFRRKIFRGLETYEELKLAPIPGMLERLGTYLVSGLLVLCLLGLIPRCKCILSEIGRHTLVIYLVHTFMLQNFTSQIYRMTGKNAALSFAVMTLLIVGLCAAIIAVQNVFRRRS